MHHVKKFWDGIKLTVTLIGAVVIAIVLCSFPIIIAGVLTETTEWLYLYIIHFLVCVYGIGEA